MLKKSITFEDYNGNQVTEDFFFNFSKAELIEMEMIEQGGLTKLLQKIIDEQDGSKIIEMFKRIILQSVGRKSEDGRRFIKSDEIRREFEQTDAYSTLFMELATDAKAASDFMNGVIPASLAAEVEKATQSRPVQEVVLPEPPLETLSREELLALAQKHKQ